MLSIILELDLKLLQTRSKLSRFHATIKEFSQTCGPTGAGGVGSAAASSGAGGAASGAASSGAGGSSLSS